MRPSELAKMNLTMAQISADAASNFAAKAGTDNYEVELAKSMRSLAMGIGQLCDRVQATYLLLEHVQSQGQISAGRRERDVSKIGAYQHCKSMPVITMETSCTTSIRHCYATQFCV